MYASQTLTFPTAPEGSMILKHPRCLTPLSTRGVSYLTRCKQNPPANAETLEMWTGSLGWEDPLEEDMATHSSIPAWRIPRTEESGRL